MRTKKLIAYLMRESEMDKFEGERTAEAISDKLKEIVQVTSEDLEPEDFNTAIGYLEV